jgi:hypothetical protein
MRERLIIFRKFYQFQLIFEKEKEKERGAMNLKRDNPNHNALCQYLQT